MKKRNTKFLIGGLLSILLLILIAYHYGLAGYLQVELPFESELEESLAIFEYNQSQHSDPIPGCWYDSGDYIVVLPRNTEALFYLSLAYRYANSELVKSDLKKVIDQQLACAEAMLNQNFKQFRDQDSHGIHLPPHLNEYFYPSANHFFEVQEGGDVRAMLTLVYQNLGDLEKASFYQKQIQERGLTTSSNCCEMGPLVLESEEWEALQGLTDKRKASAPKQIWGAQFTALLALEQKDFAAIQGLLTFLYESWKIGPEPFVYLGGNYDIAGTIALERLYAQATGDTSYRALSDRLHAYLQGKNAYDFNFTQPRKLYHPCSFFRACKLRDTLINGIHEVDQHKVDKNWQTREVQLVGQAQYVLMKVLYLGL